MAYIVRDGGLFFKRVIRQTHKERNLCRLLIHTHFLEEAVGTQHLSVIGGKKNQAVIVNILPLQLVYELSYTVIQKGSIHVDDPETEQPGSDYGEEDQNRWFYFTESGKKLKGTPESSARYTKGWFKARPSEYLMKSKYDDGEAYTYYADRDGNLYANEIRNIGGERYAFDSSGRIISGMTCVKMDDEDSSCDIEYSFSSDATVKEGRGSYEDKKSFHELVETYAEDFASGKMRMYYFGGLYGAMSTGWVL